ncbi:MAG: glycoside hydrolase family 5 protein [Robiginitomaculum sp.]|nr:glycoside hydrolase family 5 protein [Robiginitomaculum sp.]
MQSLGTEQALLDPLVPVVSSDSYENKVPTKIFAQKPHTDEQVSKQTPVQSAQWRRPIQQVTPPRRRIQTVLAPVKKCVNLGNALEAPNEGEWGYTVNVQDLRRIKQLGFDTIRLPVKWTAHMDRRRPYRIDPKLLSRTDYIIGTALDLGLKVILDVHNYDAIMARPYREIPKLKNLWHQLSTHYANWPDGLIFEVLNEAHDKMTTTKANALNAELLGIIRATNPSRWVVLGSGNWGSIDPLLLDTQEKFSPPNDPRIITTFHYYDDFDFTHQGAHFLDTPPPTGKRFGSRQQKADIAKHMAQARAFQDRTGHPLLLGEFGVYQHVPNAQRAEWTYTVRKQAEAQGLGWCYWDWATEFKMYDQNTARLVPGFGAALFQ